MGIRLQAELKAAKEERKGSVDDNSKERVEGEGDDDDNEVSEDDEHFGGGGPDEDEFVDDSPEYSLDDLNGFSTFAPPPPPSGGPSSRLECPIVISQRRPGTKTRGSHVPRDTRTAPLDYPVTGYAEIGKSRAAAKDGTLKSTKNVYENYMDKRAGAKYAAKHPDSALATEDPPQFASVQGDPTHPSVTTSWLRRAQAHQLGITLEERKAPKRVRRAEKASQSRSVGGTVRRLLPENVLYLMIVNLPTQEEIATAQEEEQKRTAG